MTPRGWYLAEADRSTSGVWAAPDAVLPCFAPAGLTVDVEGHYFGDLVARHTGSSEHVLSIHAGECLVSTTVLAGTGPFRTRAIVPDRVAGKLVELRFSVSGHFVPRAIGLGDDDRQLAWRAARILIGETVLLDATQPSPVLPIDTIVPVDGVNLVGYVVAESGVGESARSFALSCRAVGLPYGVVDVGGQNRNRQRDLSLFDHPVDGRIHAVNMLHVNADQTATTLDSLLPAYRASAATIAYWHWEQPCLPLSVLSAFTGLAEVWVPSAFVHEAVASIAPVPVFKVPHAIQFAVPTDHRRSAFGLPDDKFLVLVMYDFDSFQFRKNPQASIEAYRLACGSRHDAALVVKTINADRHPESRRELLEAVRDIAHVVFIDRYLDRREVHALEHLCDCLVSLHRAEGFGLALAEMMFLGKPVVATGWSGNTEFMTPMNSFPIEFELKPLMQPVGPYEAGQPWAEADVAHAGRVLRTLADDAARCREVGARAAADIRERFSPARIGTLYRRRLSLVRSRFG